METNKIFATAIWAGVVCVVWVRDGTDAALEKGSLLFALLLPVFFYRIIAWFAGFGFPEVFAKDYGTENNPGPYLVFFWLLFLIACLFIVFAWRVM